MKHGHIVSIIQTGEIIASFDCAYPHVLRTHDLLEIMRDGEFFFPVRESEFFLCPTLVTC